MLHARGCFHLLVLWRKASVFFLIPIVQECLYVMSQEFLPQFLFCGVLLKNFLKNKQWEKSIFLISKSLSLFCNSATQINFRSNSVEPTPIFLKVSCGLLVKSVKTTNILRNKLGCWVDKSILNTITKKSFTIQNFISKIS